jgi:hypothetical protein
LIIALLGQRPGLGFVALEGGGVLGGLAPAVIEPIETARGRNVGEELLHLDDVDLHLLLPRDQRLQRRGTGLVALELGVAATLDRHAEHPGDHGAADRGDDQRRHDADDEALDRSRPPG